MSCVALAWRWGRSGLLVLAGAELLQQGGAGALVVDDALDRLAECRRVAERPLQRDQRLPQLQQLPQLRHLVHDLLGLEVLQRVELEVYARSEEHTSELQSLMRISYAVFCLKKKQLN